MMTSHAIITLFFIRISSRSKSRIQPIFPLNHYFWLICNVLQRIKKPDEKFTHRYILGYFQEIFYSEFLEQISPIYLSLNKIFLKNIETALLTRYSYK